MSSTRTLRPRASAKATLTVNDASKETVTKKSPRKRKETKQPENLYDDNLKLQNSDTSTSIKQSKLEAPKNNRKNSVSPRKKKDTKEVAEIKQKVPVDVNDIENGGWEPNNWKEVWENILKMRKLYVAPVDSLGCEECPEKGVTPEVNKCDFEIFFKLWIFFVISHGYAMKCIKIYYKSTFFLC